MTDKEIIEQIKQTKDKLNLLIDSLSGDYKIEIDTVEKRLITERFSRFILTIDIFERK